LQTASQLLASRQRRAMIASAPPTLGNEDLLAQGLILGEAVVRRLVRVELPNGMGAVYGAVAVAAGAW
jgi:hypothetical protein